MLAKRIIPTILCRGRQMVKGERFDSWRSVGHAAQAARVHAARGVDELILLDISATTEGRGPDLDLVRELSEGCFIPITVGGGVRSLKHVDALLRAGADKVAICTAAVELDGFVAEAATRFGRQAITVVVEYDATGATIRCSDVAVLMCLDDGDSPMQPIEAARWAEKMGAGEIMLSSTTRDGALQGYDLDLIREVSAAVSVPVIASGGCGIYEHMLEAFKAGADACAAGAMFQFTDATPKGAARFLNQHNVEVRL